MNDGRDKRSSHEVRWMASAKVDLLSTELEPGDRFDAALVEPGQLTIPERPRGPTENPRALDIRWLRPEEALPAQSLVGIQ
jgi:hypothetical protein